MFLSLVTVVRLGSGIGKCLPKLNNFVFVRLYMDTESIQRPDILTYGRGLAPPFSRGWEEDDRSLHVFRPLYLLALGISSSYTNVHPSRTLGP